MKSKKWILSILCILLLSGCAGGGVDPAEETIEATTETVASAVPEEIKPVSGGTLNMSMRTPKTLNPLLNEDITVDKMLKLVFEPLFVLNSEQEVTPNLADAYLLSPDGLTMAITLKSGVTWHDGTAVTADDIVFSLDTIKNASVDSIYKSALKNVAGYQKSSQSTVVITYSAPFGGCEYNLCFPIIPQHYYKGANSVDSEKSMKPLGNGLYKFVDYRLAREVKLTKVGNFKGNPYISDINITIMPDSETEFNALEQGVIDVLEVDLSSWGKFNSASVVNATSFNSNQFEFLGFNFAKSAFANKTVRQAIAYGVPYDDIISNIYLDNAVASITPINPGSWLSALSGVDQYEYDVKKMSDTIVSTGLTKEELTFTILVNEENSERVEIAQLIAGSLNQGGMSVTVDKLPFEQYKARLDTDQFDMFIGGIQLEDKLDLSRMLSSNAQASPGANYFNFSDMQMDNVINTALNAIDEESYKTAIGEVQRYCSRQLPCIGLGFKSSLLLTGERIEGIKLPVINDIYNNIQDWFIIEEDKEVEQ